jgi:hypothetical protein
MTAAGWAIQYIAGAPYALVIGLFAGIFTARLVPGKSRAIPLKPDAARPK